MNQLFSNSSTFGEVDPRNLEATLVRVNDLLCCASASAYESGDQLSGDRRALAFSVVHLLDIAKALIERSLTCVESVHAQTSDTRVLPSHPLQS
jgi:hypothetical protein